MNRAAVRRLRPSSSSMSIQRPCLTMGGFRREVQPRRQHWFLNEKVGFPRPHPRLLLGFQGTKSARREGMSSPFNDAGGCTSPQNSGGDLVSGVVAEVIGLTGHRSEPAHLPIEPLADYHA